MGAEELHCVRIISCERKGVQKRVKTPAGLLWLPCMAWVVLWERDDVRYRWDDANGAVERDGLLVPGYRTLDLSSPGALEESAGRLSTSIEEELRKASKKYCRKV